MSHALVRKVIDVAATFHFRHLIFGPTLLQHGWTIPKCNQQTIQCYCFRHSLELALYQKWTSWRCVSSSLYCCSPKSCLWIVVLAISLPSKSVFLFVFLLFLLPLPLVHHLLNIHLTHLKSREAGKHEVVDACAKLGDSKGAAQWLRKAHEELFVSLVLLQHGWFLGWFFAGQNLVNHLGVLVWLKHWKCKWGY